jgi:hypothetical protein
MNVRVWAADGLDNWQDNGWIEDVQSQAPARAADTGPSGVALSRDVANLFAVMRFAELVKQRRVREMVERAISALRQKWRMSGSSRARAEPASLG